MRTTTIQTVLVKRIMMALVAIAFLSGCDFLHLVWSELRTHDAKVTIVNDSEDNIVKGHVVICDQGFDFDGLAPHESRVFRYKVSCEGDYDLTATFASGRRLQGKIGYVTSGSDFIHQLNLTPQKIGCGPMQVGEDLSKQMGP